MEKLQFLFNALDYNFVVCFAGRVIISAGSDGLLAVSSPSTGLTLRVLNDHKGAAITDLHVSANKVTLRLFLPLLCGPFHCCFSVQIKQKFARK